VVKVEFDWGCMEIMRLANCVIIDIEVNDSSAIQEGKYKLSIWDYGVVRVEKQTWKTVYENSPERGKCDEVQEP